MLNAYESVVAEVAQGCDSVFAAISSLDRTLFRLCEVRKKKLACGLVTAESILTLGPLRADKAAAKLEKATEKLPLLQEAPQK
jgi:hypothetical protein